MKWFSYILIFIVVGVVFNLMNGRADVAGERTVAGIGILVFYCIGWGIYVVIKKLMGK